MMYQVSIVIPTLNEERFIERCLDSVRQQSYPFEQMDIMVVDGGSSDKTCEIVQAYSERHPNVRLLHNSKKIQSVAFNIGVDNSTTPYIVRLDAHAFYHNYYIEGCVKRLKEDGNRGNVGGQWDIKPQNDSIWAKSNAILNSSRFGIGGATYRIGAKAGNVDTVPFGAFPRKVIDEIGGMREDLPRGEDNEYNSRIRKSGYDIFFDPEIVCDYYARPTLGSSCRQMYANGISIGHLFYVDCSAIGLRHFIPLVFVLSLIISIIGSMLWRPFLWLLLLIIIFYSICAIGAAVALCKKNGLIYLFVMPVLFLSVHCAYGWGTLVGLIKYLRK